MAAPSRHPLLATTGWLLPLAVAVALGGAATAHSLAGHLVTGWFAALGGAAWLWQRRQRPVLLLDDAGWAIERNGKETLRVPWSEVVEARVDRGEDAVYLDCGNPARNLLVPPRRGFGFRFADQERLLARVLAALPAERVRQVERLDRNLGLRAPDDVLASANAGGPDANASGPDANAGGPDANASGSNANASGSDANASSSNANARGSNANASGPNASDDAGAGSSDGHGSGNKPVTH